MMIDMIQQQARTAVCELFIRGKASPRRVIRCGVLVQ